MRLKTVRTAHSAWAPTVRRAALRVGAGSTLAAAAAVGLASAADAGNNLNVYVAVSNVTVTQSGSSCTYDISDPVTITNETASPETISRVNPYVEYQDAAGNNYVTGAVTYVSNGGLVAGQVIPPGGSYPNVEISVSLPCTGSGAAVDATINFAITTGSGTDAGGASFLPTSSVPIGGIAGGLAVVGLLGGGLVVAQRRRHHASPAVATADAA